MTAWTARRGVRWAHYGFLLGMVVKALDGLLELLGALGLMAVSTDQIESWVWRLTANSMGDDTRGHVARMLRHGAAHFNGDAKHFATTYLLIEGIVKLLLVAGLLRGIRWSYPLGLALLALFCVYQGIHLLHAFSWFLVVLAIMNLIVMVFIAIEWRARAQFWAAR